MRRTAKRSKPFTDCTGATVTYEGSKEFEAQIGVRVNSGNPPDVAIFPQPGLLSQIVELDRCGQAADAGRPRSASDQYYARTG